MLLAIDAGNTNTVLGLFNERKLFRTWRISTHPIPTPDELRARLHALAAVDGLKLDFASMSGLDTVASSVVPQFTGVLRQAFGGTGFHVIDNRAPFSFRIAASPPEQVGADRLVNAEAVVREHGAPAIVVDSGTATTICALARGRDGIPEYRGGAIMPGIELGREALARKAAQLFPVELVPPSHVIGTNTQDALRSGILHGYASMVDGMIRKFKQELGAPAAPVVATGGISELLRPVAREIDHFDPDLTLKGIAFLHETLRSR